MRTDIANFVKPLWQIQKRSCPLVNSALDATHWVIFFPCTKSQFVAASLYWNLATVLILFLLILPFELNMTNFAKTVKTSVFPDSLEKLWEVLSEKTTFKLWNIASVIHEVISVFVWKTLCSCTQWCSCKQGLRHTLWQPLLFVSQDAPPQYYSSRQTLVGSSCPEQTQILDDNNIQVREPIGAPAPSKHHWKTHSQSPLATQPNITHIRVQSGSQWHGIFGPLSMNC